MDSDHPQKGFTRVLSETRIPNHKRGGELAGKQKKLSYKEQWQYTEGDLTQSREFGKGFLELYCKIY